MTEDIEHLYSIIEDERKDKILILYTRIEVSTIPPDSLNLIDFQQRFNSRVMPKLKEIVREKIMLLAAEEFGIEVSF